MKKTNKGFTLVELLAVIVILAIIMIIAIPAVLETMQSARKKTFKEYAMKVTNEGQKTYLADQLTSNPGSCALYKIKTDLGLNNTGDYNGYVVVKNLPDKQKVYVTLYDNEYMVYGVELSNLEGAELQRYTSGDALSENNILSVANCGTYTEKTDSANYETKTETLTSTPQSSTPEVKKLFTGEKQGANDWVGVYENGTMTGCYNKLGNANLEYTEWLNDGSLETSYCVGQGFESTSESACEAHKSITCCTGSATENVGVLASQTYHYFFSQNNNSSGSTKSCGVLYYKSGNSLVAASSGSSYGGGLPETGVYED